MKFFLLVALSFCFLKAEDIVVFDDSEYLKLINKKEFSKRYKKSYKNKKSKYKRKKSKIKIPDEENIELD